MSNLSDLIHAGPAAELNRVAKTAVSRIRNRNELPQRHIDGVEPPAGLHLDVHSRLARFVLPYGRDFERGAAESAGCAIASGAWAKVHSSASVGKIRHIFTYYEYIS